MSLLQERLLRLKKTAVDTALGNNPVSISRNSDLSYKWEAQHVKKHSNLYGSFMIKVIHYSFADRPGKYRMSELIGNTNELHKLVNHINNKLKSPDMEYHKLLFFDTETTGLGSGAGNVAFMIGLGYYTQEAFVIEQLFIQNPGEERSMLYYLQDKFKGFTHLVSYNGKSFDWPLILNRFVMHRMEINKNTFQHLDLLYPSRSLWKHTLPTCRLSVIEEHHLKIKRMNDVPGSLAPTLYFQYLAERDPQVVQAVFHHNELDIVALAQLAIHFSNVIQGQLMFESLTLEEVFRLGIWLEKIGKEEMAEQAYEYILNLPCDKKRKYMFHLASVYKKKRKYAKAVQLWHDHIDNHSGSNPLAPVEPYIELAIYYEHHKKDIKTALKYAQTALEKAIKRSSLIRSTKQSLLNTKLQSRLDRLTRKYRDQSSDESLIQ